MCELCETDSAKRKAAEDRHHYVADRLNDLQSKYRMLANGTINPHSEQAKLIKTQAESVIRDLVIDWI